MVFILKIELIGFFWNHFCENIFLIQLWHFLLPARWRLNWEFIWDMSIMVF